MDFDEGIKMEKRVVKSVTSILMGYNNNGVKSIQLNGFQGKRSNNSGNLFDVLGFDVILTLLNGKDMKVQVKCGSLYNWEHWGKPRHSFPLGAENDIIWQSVIETPIHFYDLLLVGYEVKPCIFAPWTLISWPLLMKRIHNNSKNYQISTRTGDDDENKICIAENGSNGKRFAWCHHRKLIVGGVNPTKYFNIDLFG